jgi:hypothetical protein
MGAAFFIGQLVRLYPPRLTSCSATNRHQRHISSESVAVTTDSAWDRGRLPLLWESQWPGPGCYGFQPSQSSISLDVKIAFETTDSAVGHSA